MEHGIKSKKSDLSAIGLDNKARVFWNYSIPQLVEHAVKRSMGELAENGSLVIDTGQFKGRAPKDRFIVRDEVTEKTVDWNNINMPFSPEKFDSLFDKVIKYLQFTDLYVREAYACADPDYRLNIRVINEYPWQNIFAYNLFLRPEADELEDFEPDWHIVAAPGFQADPVVDGTHQGNFAIINFTRRIILIGGTGYTGEMKKGIFSVLNYILPQEKNVLSMHCSANVGKEGDTAVFFGLSGTGKTTLSADPNRMLIGDDEHGWTDKTIFNFEGGCYAKCINLTEEKEPEIYHAIKFGALVENTMFYEGTREIDYDDSTKTENTRVAYPIYFIEHAQEESIAGIPKNIFFLTCDAFGVLPPISKLTPGQAMYHFISGYTAKVAGTEAGITDPVTAFSACFGAPFLPLHPTHYAEMLGRKMRENKVNVWLVNTGWTGGPYGVGKRMKLIYTRAMVTAALEGKLNKVDYESHPVFGLMVPTTCPDVPDNVLNPVHTWENEEEYFKTANELAEKFNANFEQYRDKASEEMLNAAPKVYSTT